MSERTVNVYKACGGIKLKDVNFGLVYIPEDEIDAIMEDIKNLR